MSQVLSRTTARRSAAAALAGGLLFAGLTACASSKSSSSDSGATAKSGGSPAAAACPALGAPAAAPAASGGGHVSVYSADGLMNTTDDNNWYNKEFKKFKELTGITVDYVEDGSGGVESKVETEKNNPKADVLITLPPFIQKAEAAGVLQAYTPVCADKIDPSLVDKNGQWEAVMGNYAAFVYNTDAFPAGAPKTWQDLLDPKWKGKVQYSTPGQAGDGTAVMIKAIHDFGSRQAAFDYFKQLQPATQGPSKSTGKLETKVNTGDLVIANGDVQMNYVDGKNQFPKMKIWFPNNTTFSLPYMAGLVKNGPDTDNGKKLIDFLLSEQAQLDTSAMAYGFPARSDIKPADANYAAISALIQNVTVFPVDWSDVQKNYAADVKAWDDATGTPGS